MTQPDDEPRALQGDEAELFAAYATRLRKSVGGAINTAPENIDDACAFAWLQLVRRQPERETAYGWLWKVAWREALRLDQSARRVEARETIGDDMRALGEPILAVEVVMDARERLAALPEHERNGMFLRGAGFTYADAASRLGISTAKLNGILTRANARLQERELEMQKEAPDASPRAKLLAELVRQPPAFLHASIGRPPALRDPQLRLEWSRVALAIVDYRLKHGVADPARPFGAEPARPDDAARRSLERQVASLGASRDRQRDRGIER